MTLNISSAASQLSDHDILARVHCAVQTERHATANLIALLVELDRRRLYLGEGFSSLFTYCTQALHLSEHAAYNRIETARAVRRFPVILDLVESGAVMLTAVRLLAPHLTDVNHRELLESAHHKSKREVEVLIATLAPAADAPSVVRKLPTTAVSAQRVSSAPQRHPNADEGLPIESSSRAPGAPPRAEVKPLAPQRYKIQITVSQETYDKLTRAQDLLRHVVPTGDPATILERALDLLVANLERTKLSMTNRPRLPRDVKSTSRHIPAQVKRAVWQRDGGRCAFNGRQGRCRETGFLEFHHVRPFASGGETSADNLELRCRSHNQYEADQCFAVTGRPQARETREVFGDLRHPAQPDASCMRPGMLQRRVKAVARQTKSGVTPRSS